MNSNQARDLMFKNAVKLRIYPIAHLEDDPMGEWIWDVEIVIPNNQWECSDEDGNFYVTQHGVDSFYSIESAFTWAFKWLKGRGYDISNIDLSAEIVKKSDLEMVGKLIKEECEEYRPTKRREAVSK